MKIVKLYKETNEIQRVVTLRNSRNSRHQYQEFVLEGRIAIEEAYKKGWKIKALFYDKDRPLSQWAQQHLDHKNYDVAYEITSFLMDKITDRTDPSELIAIAQTQVLPFSSYKPVSSGVVVVLDCPKSSGNLGMMIRSAVCFGAQAIVLSGHAADEYDPKCIRASVGTFFSIPIYRVEGISKFSEKLCEIQSHQKVTVVASGDKGSSSLENMHFNQDLLFLILGNETKGVSAGYKEIAQEFVHIPLSSNFTSLNIAAAGSIFLYEIFRQKNKQS